MFIDNKYRRTYYSIIENARKLERAGYLERHHIVPKSLGGTNKKSNLVSLTFREHFVCHRLLPRFTEGTARQKMLKALWCIGWQATQHKRLLSSKQYAICRHACVEAASLYRHSEETKRKISTAHKGKKKSEEHRKNIGASSRGRIWSDESRSQKSIQMSGEGNTRALGWKIIYETGEQLVIKSLKSWCRENNFPIWQFYDTDYKDKFYNGVRAVKFWN
jgi:hypothetical protein